MASTSKEMFNEISNRIDNIEKMLNLLLAKDLVDGVEKFVGEPMKEKQNNGKGLSESPENEIPDNFDETEIKRLLKPYRGVEYGGVYLIDDLKCIGVFIPKGVEVIINEVEEIRWGLANYCFEHDCYMMILFIYDEVGTRHRNALINHGINFYVRSKEIYINQDDIDTELWHLQRRIMER